MSLVNIHLFGKFEIDTGGQPYRCFHSKKAQELFCFLLLFSNQPHHREKLADMFWGERCVSDSKKYFRKTLWQLQSALNQLPVSGISDLLSIESNWLQYKQNDDIFLDVMEIEKVYSGLKNKRGRDLTQQEFQEAKAAEAVYKGDLLEGCSQDWCLYERERLKEMYIVILDKMMGFCEANCDYETGISYGKKILAADGVRENTHLRLMRLYSLAGDRTSAIRQFETCRRMLKEEFGVEPSETTVDIYQKIIQSKNDPFDDLPCTSNPLDMEPIDRVSYIASLEKIKELVALQESIQEQLLKKIQIIEDALFHQ